MDAVRTLAGDGDITVDERAMYVYSYYKARHHVVFQYHYSSNPQVTEFYEIFVARFFYTKCLSYITQICNMLSSFIPT